MPPQHFFDKRDKIRKAVPICEGRKSVLSNDAVNLLLSYRLNRRVEDHREEESKHTRRRLYWYVRMNAEMDACDAYCIKTGYHKVNMLSGVRRSAGSVIPYLQTWSCWPIVRAPLFLESYPSLSDGQR